MTHIKTLITGNKTLITGNNKWYTLKFFIKKIRVAAVMITMTVMQVQVIQNGKG